MTSARIGPWKVGDPDPTAAVRVDSDLDYCWAPSFSRSSTSAVFCTWSRNEPHPAQHVHGANLTDGSTVVRAVWDAEPDDAGGYRLESTPPGADHERMPRVWGPRETYPLCTGPVPGESDSSWTGRMLDQARSLGTNRQCSIGWHGECSDFLGLSCRCCCHVVADVDPAVEDAVAAGLAAWDSNPAVSGHRDHVEEAVRAALAHLQEALGD